MKIGLLWFDDDPSRDLADKVERAVRHYRQKHGQAPNMCYVHPSAVDGKTKKVGGVHVAPRPTVLRNHFWIGKNDDRTEVAGSVRDP